MWVECKTPDGGVQQTGGRQGAKPLAAARAVMRMNECTGKWGGKKSFIFAKLVDPWENINS